MAARDVQACAVCWVLPGAVLSPSGRRLGECTLLSSGVLEVVKYPTDPAITPMVCACGRFCAAELGDQCSRWGQGHQ